MLDFDFLEPEDVSEAGRMVADLGDDCRVIAGGTALMLAMRQRMLTPTHLVSIGHLAGLRTITIDDSGWLRMGALCTHAEIAASPLVRTHWPMLASMASRVANPQVRHQGTLGGNLCYADPATDPPGCLLALDALVVLASSRGERVLRMDEFLVDYYTTALQPDELLTEIRVPPLAADIEGLYARHLRTAAEHRPLVSVALLVRRKGTVCMEARIAVAASVPIATRVARAEALLGSMSVTPDIVAEVARIVADDITPVDDARGSAEYRRNIVQVVTRRSLAQLFSLPQE
jgi:aerobic carbon-monoxide dehydrogenase medium subunit